MKVYKPTELAFGLGLIPMGLILIFFVDVNFYIGLSAFAGGVGLLSTGLKKPK
jgi:hypothetical protein